jgi:hypothetical protein
LVYDYHCQAFGFQNVIKGLLLALGALRLGCNPRSGTSILFQFLPNVTFLLLDLQIINGINLISGCSASNSRNQSIASSKSRVW